MAADKMPEQARIETAIPDFGGKFTNLSVISCTKRTSAFRAKESATGAWVFIKMLNQARARDHDAVIMFLNESSLLKMLSRQIPVGYVVPILEISYIGMQPYFVQPYLKGWSLSHAMQRQARFHILSAVRLIEKCLEILVQIHSEGVVHGDLSPENLMVVTDAELRQDGILPESFSLNLVDFESAKRSDGTENRLGLPVIGKAPYMAPELVKDSAPTPQSDLYALGILFYEMLVGHRPYTARTVEDIGGLKPDSVPPIPRALGIPQLLECFLHGLIAYEKKKRFQTAVEALAELRKMLELHKCLNLPVSEPFWLGTHDFEPREEGEYVETRAQTISDPYLPKGTGAESHREKLNGHSDSAGAVSATPDGRRTVAGSDVQSLRVWDVESGINSCSDRLDNERVLLKSETCLRPDLTTDMTIPFPESTERQLVDFSVHAPEFVASGSTFLLDIWAYLPVQRQEMLERASRLNRQVEVGSRSNIVLPWQVELSLNLKLEQFEIENPIESFYWQGTVSNVSFSIRAPQCEISQVFPGQVQVLNGGMLITRLFFEISVTSKERDIANAKGREVAKRERRVRTAFASYSSHERVQVIQRVQGMAALGVDVFLDVVSLRAGQRWEQEIRKAIDGRDIFYLFWSGKAKSSHHVEMEWRYALEQRGIEFIHPVPLEDPRSVPPPEELSGLHFNDIFLAYLQASV